MTGPRTAQGSYDRRRDMLLQRIRQTEWEWGTEVDARHARKSVTKKKNKQTHDKNI